MKVAFVTFYYTALNDKLLEIHNGFSFIHHLIGGDHIFITTKDEPGDVKERLKGYERIYASTSFHPESEYLKNVVDERWVIGGPSITTKASLNYWKMILGRVTIIDKPFESLLGEEISSTYTEYWNELVEKFSPKLIRFSAVCDKRCYWNKCSFCALRYNHKDTPSERLFGRDVDVVLKQLPEYTDKIASCYIACNAVSPMVLNQLINSKHRKSNYVYHVQVRFDREVKMILEQADDLHNFEMGVGLEFPSQTAINMLNKGLELDVELETLKIASAKGAKIQLYIMVDSPMLNEKTFTEACKSIDWMKENLTFMDWEARIFLDEFNHTKPEFFEGSPVDIIRKYGGVNMYYSPFVWKTAELAEQWGAYTKVGAAYGNTVYINKQTEKQKELSKLYWEKLMSMSKHYVSVPGPLIME
jgi:hypothetical protein